MKLMNAPQIREVDRVAIEDWGIPGVVLMENAGAGTTRLLRQHIAKNAPPTDPTDLPIAIFAGPGNNGGDGYVIARHLNNQGHKVWVFLCTPSERITGDAAINYQILTRMTDVTLIPCTNSAEFADWPSRLTRCSAIVDALLGTGIHKDVTGWFLHLIQVLNEIHGPSKLAVDIPSGLDPLTGRPRPICFRADLTTTYACAKVGLVMADALPHVGQLHIVDIGVPQAIIQQIPGYATLIEDAAIHQEWPQHHPNSHKGTFGHLLLIAGAPGTIGAALMAGQAALRTGVGLCTLATPTLCTPTVEGKIPEIMCQSIPQDTSELAQLWHNKRAIAFGPGVGTGQPQTAWLKTILQAPLPLVIDADGLNLLAEQLPLLRTRQAPTILTPHPGEMGRLTQQSTQHIQENRIEIAQAFAQEYQVTLVLKGARTVIASPDGHIWINPSGNPGLATGGSGDVLTGMIGALLARQCHPTYAAKAAVYLHGCAADSLVKDTGYSAMLATDILQALPKILANWEKPCSH